MERYWGADWAAFTRDHRPWVQRHLSGGEVLYRLPQRITEWLARPLSHGRPILSPEDQRAEAAFDEVCNRHWAEGVYRGQMVAYPYLRPPVPPPPQELFRSRGLSDEQIAQIDSGFKRCHELQIRNKGYIGRLIADPTFLACRDALRDSWKALPDADRPALPLRRAVDGLLGEGAMPASLARTEFQDRLESFLDRYGLLALTTWELPEPAGPLLDGEPKPQSLLAGRSVQIALPAHFLLLGTDDLQGQVNEVQRRHILAAGLDPSCVGPRSAESYGHLFEIDHFCRVANGRYGRPPRPKGFVGRLHDALAQFLDVGADHFRKLYRDLKDHLRGNRRSPR